MPSDVWQHDMRAAEALWRFNRDIIDAVHDLVPVVKPQLAFYERYGLAGMQAYVQTVRYARGPRVYWSSLMPNAMILAPLQWAMQRHFLAPRRSSSRPCRGISEADALTVNAFLGVTGSRRSSTRHSSTVAESVCARENVQCLVG